MAIGLTIGNPEVVGTFANGLFQIWHGISFDDAPSPGRQSLAPVRLMKS
jgi:hypothetical protein